MIRETENYNELVELFIKNGLEFSEDEPVETTDILKCWEARKENKLIGGCVLANRQGKYIIDGIAVEPEFRKGDLGSKLLHCAINYLKEKKASELYLVARAPGFFKTQGFKTVPREDAPNFFECFGCDQYQKTCFPEVMVLHLEDRRQGKC